MDIKCGKVCLTYLTCVNMYSIYLQQWVHITYYEKNRRSKFGLDYLRCDEICGFCYLCILFIWFVLYFSHLQGIITQNEWKKTIDFHLDLDVVRKHIIFVRNLKQSIIYETVCRDFIRSIQTNIYRILQLHDFILGNRKWKGDNLSFESHKDCQ
jgi:hypothetical protein